MANAGSVTIKIKGDDSAYKRTLTGISNATKTAVKGMTAAIGTLSAAWSAVGLVSVKYNAEMEQLQTSFKVMTGSVEKAEKVMERLRKLGAKTPFASKDLAQATQLLMQYGFGADAAIDSIEMLGDISQGSAEKLTRIATAYGQMTSAGKVHLEDVKQMIEAGFNPLLEISEKTGESMDSLYDRISKGTLAVSEITAAMQSATSEGGRFFGSMAAQSETVQGLLSTLKDELQTLGGDVFEPISDSLREKVLPEAIRVVHEMQGAYGRGGMDGLVDSLTNEIPRLVDATSAALEKVAVKLKAKLPGILKKLISTLPSLLASAGDSILPTLVDTIFDIIAVAVEEIVGRLPELLPVILRGFGNLLKSVATGLWDVTEGLFSGIETALKKWGLLGMTPLEAFEEAWEKADTSQIKDVDIDLGVNITVEEYQSKIDAALEEVRTALENVPGLTDDQKTAIETAIIEGTGIDLIEEALTSFGVSPEKAQEIAGTITTAKTTIETTLTDLGLDDIAIANITALQNSGGNVKKALEEDYGIDTTKASAAADTINTAMDSIDTAVAGVGLDDETVRGLKLSAVQDKVAIETALRMMGVDETVIGDVLASYDTVAGSLTAGIDGIYEYIATTFTDGVKESNEQVQKAKGAIENVAREVQERLDKWYADELANLEGKNLSEAAFTAEAERITGTYNELSEGIEDTTGTLIAQTEGMVGKSRSYCEQAVTEMQGYFGVLEDLVAQVDILTNEKYDTARIRRRLVQEGVVTNEQHQFEAMVLTAEELTERLQIADAEAAAAYEEAAKNLGENSEAYKARAEEIATEYAQAQGVAYEIYGAEISKILAGIVKATPDLSEAFEDFNAEQAAVEMINYVRDAVAEATSNSGINAEDFWEGLKIKGIDPAFIAEKIGMDEETLKKALSWAVDSNDITDAGEFMSKASEYVGKVQSDLSTAMQNAGIDATAIPAIKKAIEEGYLKAAGDVDFTSTETILTTMFDSTVTDAASGMEDMSGTVTDAAETAVSGVPSAMDKSSATYQSGADTAEGFARGIASKQQLAIAAAKSMALGAVSTINRVLQIASPSKVAAQAGAYFGQGFALGIRDEIESARNAAQQMASSALGAIDSIGGRISVSQQINAGGMASAFQTMLAGLNLATDNGQPVQLFINGRLVAETIKRDIAQTQAGYNMDLARGVGKA